MKLAPVVFAIASFALVECAQGSSISVVGQGNDGPGGWNLSISANVTAAGTTGQVQVVGGVTGPVVQVVPPGDDGCGCWCINVQRTDTLPQDGDQRTNVYLRDTGDGVTGFDQFSLVSGIGIDCTSVSKDNLFFLTLKEGDFQFVVTENVDSDGDGVADDVDQCPGTPAGTVVNAHGCSIAQLVPCEGPRSGGTWKNHGHYLAKFTKTVKAFAAAGLIHPRERKALLQTAARSDCGKAVRGPKPRSRN